MDQSEKTNEPGQSGRQGPFPGTDARTDTEGPMPAATALNTKQHSTFQALVRVFRYNDKKDVIMNSVALLAILASGTLLPLMDIIFGHFVNVFNDFAMGILSAAEYRSKVAKYSLYFIYLFIAKACTCYIWMVLLSITAIRTTKALRVDFIRSALRQEISFFDSPSSSISSQITTNGNLINNGLAENLGLTIQAISTFITAFAIAFAYQWKLTFIIFSIVPVNLIVTIICIIFDTLYEQQVFDIHSQSGTIAEEAFASIRTVHSFWAFPNLSHRFASITDNACKIGHKKSLVWAIMFPIEFLCIFSGYGLAFWQGIRMYARGEINEPGTVVTVVFAVLVAAQALTQIAPQTIAISKCAAAAQELFVMIDRPSSINALSQEGSKIEDFQGNIRLSNVWFSYPSRPDLPILRGLNLDIPAGQTTALVGASGSGKSTIFGLLERWYTITEGCITLDGHRVEELNLKWLRTNIGLVQQEPTLFSGTIFQNVADGLANTEMENLSESEKRQLVINSCKASYAHDFIETLPDGYNTVIGERGASLSGGQKQRIVIARTIICNPKVIMLDEATSALDPKAEKIVQQALDDICQGRTVIVIAHRLSTVIDADKIVVMSQGQMIEQGSHQELLELRGSYSKLIEAQDLGTTSSQTDDHSTEIDDAGEIKHTENELAAVVTAQSTQVETSSNMKKDAPFGLLTTAWIVVREQPALWGIMSLVALASIIAGGTYPAVAILFSRTMKAFQAADVKKGDFFSLMFFVIALANCCLYAISGWFSNEIGQFVMKRYRVELFEATLSQEVSFFDDIQNGAGALVSRVACESTSLQDLFSINFVLIMVNIVNVISSSILAIAVGWKLGLVLAFGALPAIVLAGYIRIRLEFKLQDDAAARFAVSSAYASEAIRGIRTISSLALESAVIDRYQASLQSLAKQSISGLGVKMIFYALSQSIAFLAMALGFWYGGRLVSTGEYSNEQFYTIYVAVIFSGEASALLFQYTTSISNATAAMKYITRLRQSLPHPEKDMVSNTSASSPAALEGIPCEGPVINFDGVSFAYPNRPDLKVLSNICLDIASSSKVAFVGASGCGKSTMISLLERFYDPTKGQIRRDGQDIKDIDRRLYRKDIALVQQEPILYQGTIYENITLGIEDNTLEEDAVSDACRQAHIWDFICSLPEGLNTLCGNQGFSLSGGQRQRIAIARALIRNPRLLLLDEATSALDTESEKIVKEALNNAAVGRTTIAVAHRLSTIRDSDLILVFAAGRIIEKGTHESLIADKGVYYEMVLGQSLDHEM